MEESEEKGLIQPGDDVAQNVVSNKDPKVGAKMAHDLEDFRCKKTAFRYWLMISIFMEGFGVVRDIMKMIWAINTLEGNNLSKYNAGRKKAK